MFEKQRRSWLSAFGLLLIAFLLASAVTAWAGNGGGIPAMDEEPAWINMIGFAIAADASDKQWQSLPPRERQERLREWRSLSPQQRRELRERMGRLKRMPEEDRQLYQRRFHQWQNLPLEERRQLLRKFDQWDSLSDEERETIRQRFRNQ